MKKKICFVVSTPYTAKSFLDNHFEILSDYYDVYLVANLKSLDIEGYANVYLKDIQHIPINRKINLLQDLKSIFFLTKYIYDSKFDLVITFTPKAGLIGIISAKLAGTKKRIHFFTGQVWHTKKGLFKALLMFLDKIIVHFSTNIIVDGEPQQNFLIENGILNNFNSTIIGKGTISGIDIEKFSPKAEVRQSIRKSLHYDERDVVFMFLGRLNKDKGILDLVQAFKRLKEIYPSVRLLIVGPDEEGISTIVNEEFQNDKRIIIFGGTTEPERLIQACDIFCLPSHREAFGLSIIEASACEKAIICSDTYGLKDTIIDNKTGLRHETSNIDSIFEKMQLLVENPDLRIELGVNGRAYVKDNFSKEIITKLWFQYLKDLL